MTAADEQDKLWWAAAKRDYERRRTESLVVQPAWEDLTERQRNSLRWLAERRSERRALKDRTFPMRYGVNPLMQVAGNAALADFDRQTQEALTPEERAEESERMAEKRRQFAQRYGMNPERARAMTTDRVGYSIPQQRLILESDIEAVKERLAALGYHDTKENS